MRNGERSGRAERQVVRSLRQEPLERRSTPFTAPVHVPVDPEPTPPTPPGDVVRGDRENTRTPSPPCYRVNVRLLRHLP